MSRSKVAARLGLNVSMENDDADDLMDLTGEESVEGTLMEVASAEEEVEVENEAIDELEEAADGLSEVAEAAEASLPEGGLEPQAARMMNIAVESYCNRLGVAKPVVTSMESFGGTSGRLRSTQVSLEGIKDMLKTIWAKIKEVLMSLRAKVKNLWFKLFDAAPKLVSRAEAIQKKARAASGTAKEDKISVSLKTIHVGGKAPNVKAAAEALKAVAKNIFEDSNKKVVDGIEGIAASLEEIAKTPSTYKADAKADINIMKNVNASAAARFGEGMVAAMSEELPGGKAAYVAYDGSASDLDSGRASLKTGMIDFAEKAKEVADSAEIKTMSLGDVEKACDAIIDLGNQIVDFRKGWETREKAMDKAIKAGDDLQKASDKDEELSVEQKKAVSTAVRASGNYMRSAPGLMDAYAVYSITAARALLSVCEKSVSQYK